MKRNTLLDFLTQRADPQSTKEFQRVFADVKKNLPPDENMQNLFQTLFHTKDPAKIQKFYDSDKPMRELLPKSSGQKLGEFLSQDVSAKGIWNAIKRQMKGKDPLDMSPSDLEHMFQVYHDPTDTSGLCRALINPKSLEPNNKSVDQIATEVDKFYNDNKEFFKSAKSVSYNKEEMILSFDGPRSKLADLLDSLGVTPENKKKILADQQELTGIWHIPLTQRSNVKGMDKHSLYQFWKDSYRDNYKAFSDRLMELREFLFPDEPDKYSIQLVPIEGAKNQNESILVFHGSISELALLLEDKRLLDDQGIKGKAAVKNIKENRSFYKKG